MIGGRLDILTRIRSLGGTVLSYYATDAYSFYHLSYI